MKQLYGYIFSLLVAIFISFTASAQEVPSTDDADSVARAAAADSIARANFKADSAAQAKAIADSAAIVGKKFSINIFVDYGKLLTLPFDFEEKYEGGVYLMFMRKWAVGAKGGKATLTPYRPYRNGDAEATGIYYGGFIQYFLNIDLYSSLFIGAGYNQAVFDDKITYTISDDIFGEKGYLQEHNDLTASWASIRLGSEQKLNKTFAVGGVIDLRIKTSFSQPEGIQPYAIPGYGKANNTTSPALNLYLKMSL